MSNSRIMFIPWKKGTLGNWYKTGMDEFARDVDINQKYKEFTHHKFDWTSVYLDAIGQPFKTIGCEKNTTICIVGHGNIGDPSICAPDSKTTVYLPGTSPPPEVGCIEIVEGLINLGLSKKYNGKIACDSCYSALGTSVAPPFARLMADELWRQGFEAVCVVGYKGALYGRYQDTNSNGAFLNQMILNAITKQNEETSWRFNQEAKLEMENLTSSSEINSLKLNKINPGMNNAALRKINNSLDRLGIKKNAQLGKAVEKLPEWGPLTGIHDLAAAARGIATKPGDNYYHRIVHMDGGTPDSAYVKAKNAQMLFEPSQHQAIFLPSSNRKKTMK